MIPRLLVNPAAGAARRLTAALELAARHGIRVVETADATATTLELRRAVDAAEPRVLLAGGDGTLHDALPVLAGRRTALGLLPCGRGNDFARALGVPLDPLAALRRALAGTPRSVDLGEWNGRPFAGALSAGFDAAVAARVRARRGGTALAYSTEALRTLAAFEPANVTIDCDGAPSRTGRTWFVALVNSGVYGGGMRIAPDARIDDGLLDVVRLRAVSRVRLATLLPAVFRGTHLRSRAFEHRTAACVRLELPRGWRVFADGEPMERAADGIGTACVAPGALLVVG